MKKQFFFKLSAVLLILSLLIQNTVFAAADPAFQSKCAKTLVQLEIYNSPSGSKLNLKNKVKRCEFITYVVKMLGYDTDTELADITLPYKDIDKSHWAYNNVKIAYKYKLIPELKDNRVSPDKYITNADALAILIKSLGYEDTLDGKWPNNVINRASELGLSKDVKLPAERQITRGECSVIIYNSLTVDFNN